MLGIHQNTYSKWELGATQLKAEKIPTLAEIYEMDLLEFCKELYEYSLNNHNQRGGNAANVVVDNASEQTVKNLESQISQLKEELGFLKEEIIFLRNLVNR